MDTRTDDIFMSLLQPTEDGPSRSDESADSTISGDCISVCISKYVASKWAALCAAVFEDKLVVCKKSKLTGEIYVTLFVVSEQTNFHQVMIPKFHAPPVAEFVLAKQAESSPSSLTPSPCLHYRPLLKVILPSAFNPSALGGLCECIEEELFHQLCGSDCPLSEAAVLLVCGPNGHILACNLRRIRETKTSQSSEGVSDQRELFKPLYSLDQPVVSIHAVPFPKRREQLDPLLFCGDDNSSVVGGDAPNCLIFLGQRGKVALCYADIGTVGQATSQKLAKFIEYTVPALILSSRLIPGQCLVYNSLRSLHRICLRQSCFKEIEERAPELQLRREPLLIPEASFKFPERVAVSIPLSVLVDCELVTTDDAMEQETTPEEVGLTLAALKGDLYALKFKVCGAKNVSRDPDEVAKEIKKCLGSIQTTSEQVSSVSSTISKVNASLAELNQVLTLLCTVKGQREGTPCISGADECPVECTVSGGFTELGVLEREMCINVRFSYHGRKALGSGWSLLIQISPSDHNSHQDHLHSMLYCGSGKGGGVAEGGSVDTPTTLSRCVPLEGLLTDGTLEERIPVSPTCGRTLGFFISCYLHYDASHLFSTLHGLDKDRPSCDHTVSVLLTSRLVDALDFMQPLMEVPRKLHQPIRLATSCLDSKNTLSSRNTQQALLHSLQLPIRSDLFTPQQLGAGQAQVYRQLSNLLLPHIEEVEEELQNGTEIRLTAYDGSSVTFRLLRSSETRERSNPHELNLSLTIKCSSRLQLAEVIRCIQHRLRQHSNSGDTPPLNPATREELYKREAELKGISREAIALLDQVTLLEKFSREPSVAERAEVVSKTFSLYTRLRHLPQH